jgi:excisionase family DNA binding protein
MSERYWSIVTTSIQNYGCSRYAWSFRLNGVDEFLTERELADLLKVTVGTVRRWRREGTGPPVLWAGGRPRYRRADVDAWLERRDDAEPPPA